MGADNFSTVQLIMVDVIGPLLGLALILFVVSAVIAVLMLFVINILSS